MRFVKSSLLALYKKATNYDKKIGVINNGEDNLYPEMVDRYINNSVTAKSCSKLMTNYLVGKGFSDNKRMINGQSLISLTRKIAKSIVRQYGVYVNVHYDGDFRPANFKILPYSSIRKGKADDSQFTGKFLYHKDWIKPKREDIKIFNAYNNKPEVVEAQVMACKGKTIPEKLKNYKGQILYINLEEDYEYALSLIDPIMKDCDSEAQSSLYKNRSLRRGFFGKTLVFTKPLSGDLEDYPNEVEWSRAETERDNFKEVIENMLGAENSGDAALMEIDIHDGEKIDDVISFQDVSSNVNDKMFEYTEASVFKNVLMAFNSVPPALVRPENSVFSASGESIQAMKEVYFNNTEYEREILQGIIDKLLIMIGEDPEELIPLIEIKKVDNANNEE